VSLAQERAARSSIGDAVRELEAFAARTTDPADRHLARSHALVYLRRPGPAVDEAMAAEDLRPDVQRQIEVGRFLVTTGQAQDAIRLLSRQAVRSPRSADVRYWLAAALVRSGRIDEARAVLREGLAVAPRDPKLREAARALGVEAAGAAAPVGGGR